MQPIDGEQASDGQQGVAGRDEADQRTADGEQAEGEAERVRRAEAAAEPDKAPLVEC